MMSTMKSLQVMTHRSPSPLSEFKALLVYQPQLQLAKVLVLRRPR
jgi:hypothetical protein